MMIENLREINKRLLIQEEDKEKYSLIDEILAEDDCFLNIDMETSYAILRDLHIKEEDLERIYKELIN